MVSLTEVKLLTLLNVTAIKRPREKDVPGGHRGSPSLGRSTPLPDTTAHQTDGLSNASSANAASGSANGANGSSQAEKAVKRRKSVVFGGEVGPSGSTFAGKRKRAKIETNGNDSQPRKANGASAVTSEMSGTTADLEEAESSDDEDKGKAGKSWRTPEN